MSDYKTVVIGNSSVGKSSITKRFVEGKFEAQLNATIGTAYLSKTIEVRDKSITFQVLSMFK